MHPDHRFHGQQTIAPSTPDQALFGNTRIGCVAAEKVAKWITHFSLSKKCKKFCKFSKGQKSRLSTNFWILSSRNARTRPNLASTSQKCRKIIEKQIQKFDRKCEKSDFVEFFSTSKKFFLIFFFCISSRSRWVLSAPEEKIQKFVDSAKKKIHQNSWNILKFCKNYSLKKMKKIT